MEEISKTHKVKFSMIDEDIAMYNFAPPDKKISLQEKLDYIAGRTRLRFEAAGIGKYTVYNDISPENPLCGYLIDSKTGKGIDGALIYFGSTTVSSGADGYFSMSLSAKGTITISHIGYSQKIVALSEFYVPGCLNITLEEEVTELKEVIAERYLAAGISRKENGELVVKPRKFGILPGLTEPDVLQTMQQLPGVISIDETVSNINVRGGTHDQNLFLWNGIRMFQTSHFFGLLSAFNPLQATTISIFKNGSPSYYGESVSSAVDISTHTPNPENKNIVAVDMINAAFLASVNLTTKDFLQVSGRRTYSDLWATPTFGEYRNRILQNTTITNVLQDQQVKVASDEKFYFYDLSLSYRHTLNEKHALFVDGIAMSNNLDIFQHTETADKNGNLSQGTVGGSATLKSKWDENNTSEVQVYVSSHDMDASNESIENEQATRQSNTIFDKGIRLNYGRLLSQNLHISAGYQFNEVSVRNFDEVNIPAFSKNEKLVSVSHAVTGQGNYASADGKTKISLGIRGNYFDKYRLFMAEPRVVFSRLLKEGLTLEVSAERKSQAISQVIDQQQDFLGIEKRRWVLADGNNIPVQKSTQASLGLTYSKRGWLATIEGFYKKVAGITSDSQDFQNQFEFDNSTGSYRVLGYEVLLQKKFSRFYTWISYTYNDNRYKFDSFVPPGFANNFAVSHAVTSAGIYEWDNFRFALGTKWRTGSPQTEPLSFSIDPNNPANSQIIYKAPNSSRLSDNLQVNLSASKTWSLGKKTLFTASCSVLNILDRHNVISRYYRINKSSNAVESVNTYGLGRTPNLSVKLAF
ncbi:TonB-dependent receptor [Flavobacterium album]|uniref:TonB-dependent receptor n=1 Tax=Flavobacterium album TaxID=2175091 RepID=UPI0015E81E9E|nr:TonB-dependent receptor plug domain-containing protein [Flavobacterium album]